MAHDVRLKNNHFNHFLFIRLFYCIPLSRLRSDPLPAPATTASAASQRLGAYGLSQSKRTNGQCRLCARPNHSLRSSMEVKCFRTNEELRKSHVLWTTSTIRNSPSINNIFTRVKLFPGAALFRHSLPLFFARIFPAPSAAGVLWVAVAHPLLMHRRAPHAWASCSPDLERALSFFSLQRTVVRGCETALSLSRIGSRCAASPPPPSASPSLFREQEPTTAPASAASPPSPLQLSTRPQKSRPKPEVATSPPSFAADKR